MLVGADKHVAPNASWANLRTKLAEIPPEGMKELASGRTNAPPDLADSHEARVNWVFKWVQENAA